MSGEQLTPATRVSDVSITPVGEKQSELTADYLASIRHVSHVIVSPMLRTIQTARPLMRRLAPKVTPEVWLDLFEEGGIFSGTRADHLQGIEDSNILHGLTIEEIKAQANVHVTIRGEPHSKGWWRGGFESPDQSNARADRVASEIWKLVDTMKHSATVVIITHGLFMDNLVRKLLKFPAHDSALVFAHNCGLHILHLHTETRRIAVAGLNVTPHLPVELRTGHSVGNTFKCSPEYLSL